MIYFIHLINWLPVSLSPLLQSCYQLNLTSVSYKWWTEWPRADESHFSSTFPVLRLRVKNILCHTGAVKLKLYLPGHFSYILIISQSFSKAKKVNITIIAKIRFVNLYFFYPCQAGFSIYLFDIYLENKFPRPNLQACLYTAVKLGYKIHIKMKIVL